MESESEPEQVTLTFDELRCFDSEDVSTCVSIKCALEICQKSLADLSVKTVEVLSLWLRKLLRGYIDEAEGCIEVLKFLYEWLLQLKKEVTPENKIACSDFIMLLADAVNFVEWAQDKLVEASERLVNTTAYFLLAIVYSCLELSCDKHVESLKEHEPAAVELHLHVLKLLVDSTLKSARIHARTSLLMGQLSQIAEFLSLTDIHYNACVTTSINMMKICSHYKSLDSSQDEGKSMPDWLQETALHLCDTISNQLFMMYQEESAVPVEKVKKSINLTLHYFITLEEFLNIGIKQLDSIVCDALICLLRSAEIKPSTDVFYELSKHVNKYMRSSTAKIYGLLYQREDFQKYLVTLLADPGQSSESYDVLCLDFISAGVAQSEIIHIQAQTAQKIFEYLWRNPSNFCNAERYKRTLEAFASLLHVAGSAELHNYFCNGLFQEDVIKSQVCSDVLMLIYRLEELESGWNSNALKQATKFWIKCNNYYSMFSQNPSQWHVQRMVTYFHYLSNNNGQSTLPTFNLRQYRFLSCVSDKKLQHLCQLRLKGLFGKPVQDIEHYYEILALMELMAANPEECLSQVSGKEQILKEMMLQGHKYKRLANIYFRLALKANPATQLRILQSVLPSESVVTSCWPAQRFLHACQNSDNGQLKSLAHRFKILPEHQAILGALQEHSDSNPNINNIKVNLASLEYTSSQAHTCQVGNHHKYSRNVGNAALSRIQQQVEQLMDGSMEFETKQLLQLNGIAEDLKGILAKQ